MFEEEDDIPDRPLERAHLLQAMMVEHATRGHADENVYQTLRRGFMADPVARDLLPPFVRTCRSLDQFWGYIEGVSPQWQPRRVHIWNAFAPLLDHLESANRAPADPELAGVLSSFDQSGVHHVWEKALNRRHADPEGAITSARTLLETVCKRILDGAGEPYTDTEDLPKLYRKVAEVLSLAPEQHAEPIFKAILGNCQSLVGHLGSLRNKIGDAHGKGGKPVRPAPRHAALAVNLAGSMATFLVETWIARQEGRS